MRFPTETRTMGLALLAAALLCGQAAFAAGTAMPAVAVAAFDYSDSSGEPRDQGAEHVARIAEFGTGLRDRLAASERFRPVDLACRGDEACSAATLPPDLLLDDAKKAGADLLVFGRIHKMSTLVGWGRIDVLDVGSGKLLFDRVISFRGDTDEAFDRAADFAAKDILRTLAPTEEAQSTTPARGIR